MKKKILVNYFTESKKWPRRIPKIKKITRKTVSLMEKYFENNADFNINLVLSNKFKLRKLNKKYKNKYEDTDVLTFVNNTGNKKLGKIFYCDIFFSIEKIESFISKYKISIYDHFNHLLVHSILHINGYEHKTKNQYNKMKKEEIKILKEFGIGNPYILQ